MLPIKGFIKSSLIEWEGKIASIVFLSQCNLRCQYCHSPHLVKDTHELETISIQTVLDSITENKEWIDGVVISGGEPTAHKGLDLFIRTFRDIGLKIKLDTNGTNPNVLNALLETGLVDYIAMDIKAPLEGGRYEPVTGVMCNMEQINESIKLIMESGIDYEFRTTVCPAYLDKADITAIAQSIRGARRYVLQSFRPNNCLNNRLLEVTPYPPEVLEEFVSAATRFVENCMVRGKQNMMAARDW